jgi:hypothetical protein
MTRRTAASRDPELIDVPERLLLMADGRGDPNRSQEFPQSTEALFAVSYALRFRIKRELGVDRRVGPLEGLWAIDGGAFSFHERSNWLWTIMIEQAEEVSPEMVDAATRAKGVRVPLRLERLREGLAAQILHVGPFADEPRTIDRLHAFIDSRRLRAVGRHHEIYLRDPRRTAPERLRTIIRQRVVALRTGDAPCQRRNHPCSLGIARSTLRP